MCLSWAWEEMMTMRREGVQLWIVSLILLVIFSRSSQCLIRSLTSRGSELLHTVSTESSAKAIKHRKHQQVINIHHVIIWNNMEAKCPWSFNVKRYWCKEFKILRDSKIQSVFATQFSITIMDFREKNLLIKQILFLRELK